MTVEASRLEEEWGRLFSLRSNANVEEWRRIRFRSVLRERRFANRFQHRLSQRWWNPLEQLRFFRLLSLELGMLFQSSYQNLESKANEHLVTALGWNHARSCLIASEILALLNSGHASGAMARWRSLHEIAVVSLFLDQHGNECAVRYIDHIEIMRAKQADSYQECCDDLGYPPLDAQQYELLISQRNQLIEKYGKPFADDWGWAHGMLVGRPSFRSIAAAVDMSRWHSHFKWSSQSVHAGLLGMVTDLGNAGMTRGLKMLSGPSNFGLADPGECTGMSLWICSHALFKQMGTVEWLEVSEGLRTLQSELAESFHRVQMRISEDESRIQAFNPSD